MNVQPRNMLHIHGLICKGMCYYTISSFEYNDQRLRISQNCFFSLEHLVARLYHLKSSQNYIQILINIFESLLTAVPIYSWYHAPHPHPHPPNKKKISISFLLLFIFKVIFLQNSKKKYGCWNFRSGQEYNGAWPKVNLAMVCSTILNATIKCQVNPINSLVGNVWKP